MFSKITNKLSVFALIIIVLGSIGAVSTKAADTPEQTAKNFYDWYLTELNNEKNPPDQKQTINKSISKRLSNWIYSPAYQEYGADYFIDAQDWDKNWQATTTKAVVKGNTATLKVMLADPKAKKSDFKQTLAIKMVKEGGVWKIDSVNNRKLTR